MNLQLQHKVIVVTGGASGIGEAICKNLAEEGAVPCILDHSAKDMDRVVLDLTQRYGVRPFALLTELTDKHACQNAIEQVIRQFGRIDGLVNNAGINDGVGLENGNLEQFIASLDKNVGHYFAVAHFALPALKAARGSIVNICSKTALTGQGGTSGYAAANGERLALTEQWARELSPYGINVNAVVVAECWTPQYKWWVGKQPDPEESLRKITAKIPLGNRMTTCDEVATSVVYLLSENAKSMSGEYMFVDGGYVFLDRGL